MSKKINLVNGTDHAIQVPGLTDVIMPFSYARVDEEIIKHPNAKRVLGKLLHVCPESADVDEFITAIKNPKVTKDVKKKVIEPAVVVEEPVVTEKELPNFGKMNKEALLAYARDNDVVVNEDMTKAEITVEITK